MTVHQAGPYLAIPFPGIRQIARARFKASIQDNALSHRIVSHGRRAAPGRGIRRAQFTPTASRQDPGFIGEGRKRGTRGRPTEDIQGICICVIGHAEMGERSRTRKIDLLPGIILPYPEFVGYRAGISAIEKRLSMIGIIDKTKMTATFGSFLTEKTPFRPIP